VAEEGCGSNRRRKRRHPAAAGQGAAAAEWSHGCGGLGFGGGFMFFGPRPKCIG
jgi:hypothetical protein